MKRGAAVVLAGAISLTAAALPVIQRLYLLPMYLEGGPGERWIALLNRLCAFLVLPGKVVIYKIWPPPEHYFMTSQLVAAACFNFFILFFVFALLLGAFSFFEEPGPEETLEDVQLPEIEHDEQIASTSRRAFLIKATTGAAALGAMGVAANQVLVAPGNIGIRKLTVPIRGLPRSLAGLTIAQLTDFHHDEWISLHQVRQSVELTNALQPDIVALTGDYVTANPKLIGPAVGELARLKPKLGVLGCMGNHDWWADVGETRKQFAANGLALIDNSRLFVSSDRRLVSEATEGLCIGAVGDLWEDAVEPEKAFHKVPELMPRILLSHNPDLAEQGRVGSGQTRVDLMLSGHTHGGQVRLPGLGAPLLPSAYGQKYAQGLVKGPSCLVQVSAGIGLALLPVRLNVQPEIVFITLQPA